MPIRMASIANYLVHYGWVKGRDWGFEVTVPESVSCALEGPDQGKPHLRLGGDGHRAQSTASRSRRTRRAPRDSC